MGSFAPGKTLFAHCLPKLKCWFWQAVLLIKCYFWQAFLSKRCFEKGLFREKMCKLTIIPAAEPGTSLSQIFICLLALHSFPSAFCFMVMMLMHSTLDMLPDVGLLHHFCFPRLFSDSGWLTLLQVCVMLPFPPCLCCFFPTPGRLLMPCF